MMKKKLFCLPYVVPCAAILLFGSCTSDEVFGIASISPSSGYYLGGTVIVIEGARFTKQTTVKIGDRPCASIETLSETKITCVTPSTIHEPSDVDVTIADYGTDIRLKNGFTYKTFSRVDSIAGNNESFGSSNGNGENATFNSALNDFAISGTDLFVADGTNYKIRKIDLSSLDATNVKKRDVVVSTVAGDGTKSFTDSTNGTGSTASFMQPAGVFLLEDTLYVPDVDWTVLAPSPAEFRTVNAKTGETMTLISSGNPSYSQLAYDGEGYFYAADCNFNRVDKIKISDGSKTLIAGGTVGDSDGVGSAAKFNCPYGIVIDGEKKNLYVGEFYNQKIKKIEISSKKVTTLVDSSDGIDVPTKLQYADQYLLVSNWTDCVVRQIRLSDKKVTVFAGKSGDCSAAVDGTLSFARFKQLDALLYAPNYGVFVGSTNWGWAGNVSDGLVRLVH